jgi:hypothetical protein
MPPFFCGDFNFSPQNKKIEMDRTVYVECSEQATQTQRHINIYICPDNQKATDRKHSTCFSRRQKRRQRRHQNRKQRAKNNVQSNTPNMPHLMLRSWLHTELHILFLKSQADLHTKKRAKHGSMDSKGPTASSTTGHLTSRELKTCEVRQVREINRNSGV